MNRFCHFLFSDKRHWNNVTTDSTKKMHRIESTLRRFSIIPWQPSFEECFLNLEQKAWTLLLFSSVKHKRKQGILFNKYSCEYKQRATNIHPSRIGFRHANFTFHFPGFQWTRSIVGFGGPGKFQASAYNGTRKNENLSHYFRILSIYF